MRKRKMGSVVPVIDSFLLKKPYGPDSSPGSLCTAQVPGSQAAAHIQISGCLRNDLPILYSAV